MDEFTVPLTPEQRRAIATPKDERTDLQRFRVAVACLKQADWDGAHIGRVQGRDTSGRFASEDE
jgi:hypothetical protein